MSGGFTVHFSYSETEEEELDSSSELIIDQKSPDDNKIQTKSKSDDSSKYDSDDLPSIQVLEPYKINATKQDNLAPQLATPQPKRSSSTLTPSASTRIGSLPNKTGIRSTILKNSVISPHKYQINMDSESSYYSEEEEDSMEFKLHMKNNSKFINPIQRNTNTAENEESDAPQKISDSLVENQNNSSISVPPIQAPDNNQNHVKSIREHHEGHSFHSRHRHKRTSNDDGKKRRKRSRHSEHHHRRHTDDFLFECMSPHQSRSSHQKGSSRSCKLIPSLIMKQPQSIDSALKNELENPEFYISDTELDPNTSLPLALPPPPQYEKSTTPRFSEMAQTSVRSYDGNDRHYFMPHRSHRSHRQHRSSDVSYEHYSHTKHRRSHSRSANISSQVSIGSSHSTSEDYSQLSSARSGCSDCSHSSVYSDSIIVRTFPVYRCHRTLPKFWGGTIQFELFCQNKQILSAKTKGFTRSQVIIAPGTEILNENPPVIATINVKDSTANFDLIQGGEVTQMISFVHQTDILPRQVVVNFNLPIPGLPRRLVNLKPIYNKEKGTWQINFKGRFVIKSSKNMILVDENKKRMMIVRKIATDDLEVEISKPFQDLTIFFIAISTLICSF